MSLTSSLPNVPTFKELGYGNLVAIAWWTVAGLPGLPTDIVKTLHAAVNQALDTSSVRQRLEREEMKIEPMSRQQATQFVENEIQKWRPIALAVLKVGGRGK